MWLSINPPKLQRSLANYLDFLICASTQEKNNLFIDLKQLLLLWFDFLISNNHEMDRPAVMCS